MMEMVEQGIPRVVVEIYSNVPFIFTTFMIFTEMYRSTNVFMRVSLEVPFCYYYFSLIYCFYPISYICFQSGLFSTYS